MSHFVVAVIVRREESTDFDYFVESKVSELLAPFEEKEVPKYMEHTKEELIEIGRRNIERYKNAAYAEYLKDPEAYEAKCKNEGHMEYLKVKFPKMLNWTDEEVYQNELRWYDEEMIGKDGEVYSTYNPLSKWDWYSIGGRWDGLLPIKCDMPTINYNGIECIKEPYVMVNAAIMSDVEFNRLPTKDEVTELKSNWTSILNNEFFCSKEHYIERYKDFDGYLKSSIEFSTYAVLTPDGEWHEPGEMGWWGISSASDKEQEEWDETFFDKYITPYNDDDHIMVIVDCHI